VTALTADLADHEETPMGTDTTRKLWKSLTVTRSPVKPAAAPVPCTVDTSCEAGHHTYSWPCDYAPGTGRLAEEMENPNGH
jgi:hypothetical protein